MLKISTASTFHFRTAFNARCTRRIKMKREKTKKKLFGKTEYIGKKSIKQEKKHTNYSTSFMHKIFDSLAANFHYACVHTIFKFATQFCFFTTACAHTFGWWPINSGCVNTWDIFIFILNICLCETTYKSFLIARNSAVYLLRIEDIKRKTNTQSVSFSAETWLWKK